MHSVRGIEGAGPTTSGLTLTLPTPISGRRDAGSGLLRRLHGGRGLSTASAIPGREEHGPAGARVARWTEALAAALHRVPPEFLLCQHRSAPWKRAVALQLHASTDVSNGWLAQQLDMDSAACVSKHLGLTRRKPSACLTPLLDLLHKGEGEA